MDPDYKPQEIEPRWQSHWEETGLYATHQGKGQPKYYCLNFFPYPSGEGLHVGHCRNYIPTDVIARYQRMRGYNVLYPMGWDAFGEPTEQHAIAHGIHPRLTTDRNTANFRRQLTILGTSFDWTREIDSSKPEFYRWTQWFFLLLYRRGLAYRDTNWQWWCPTCQTTLSSHEAAGGVCWRGHPGVTKRAIPAWYFRITADADTLLEGLDDIDWPERIKTMQRNWIGRSEGWEIGFPTRENEVIFTYTTRPDTLPGVTFLVLAPEHPMLARLTTPEQRLAVTAITDQALRQSEIERTAPGRPKTGAFIGAFALNPVTDERVPIWTTDYVLPSYGTGAVMAVPAHDERDFAFAQQYHLPIRIVVAGPDFGGLDLLEAYSGPGVQVNSGPFDGLANQAAGERIIQQLQVQGLARRAVNYKMRDWLISRQRYWGTPIPIVYCQVCGEQPVPEDQLPVLLPAMEDFTPDGSGKSPLARLPDFVHTTCPACDGPAQRETDTMGGFACSSWYFLRFTSPHDDRGPFDPEAMRTWMPVDLYVGGAEHATLHLLYARFWTHVMHAAGLVPFREPFPKLLNQGVLHGPDGYRMSKSRGNIITPDTIIADSGADALRVYELFMAPFHQDVNWNTDGINGASRFLQRIWSLYLDSHAPSAAARQPDPALERALHQTIRAVSIRIQEQRFNTLISTLMTFVNLLVQCRETGRWQTRTFHQALDTLLLMLAPVAPHIAEEIWHQTGHADSVHAQSWPEWDPGLAQEETVELPVQVDGKTREVISAAVEAQQDEIQEEALSSPRLQPFLEGRQILRVIYVPGRVVNFVTRPGGIAESGASLPHADTGSEE